MDGLTEFTVEVWAKYNGSGTQIIVSNRDVVGSGFLLGYWLGEPLVQVAGANFTGNSGSITLDTWHHLAAVRDGADLLTIYVDGVSVRSDTGAGSVTTSAPLWVGADEPTNTELQGDLYNLKVWSTARTVTQINESMRQNTPTDSTGLRANWRMAEGAGQLMSDETGAYVGVLGTVLDEDTRDPTWVLQD